MNPKRFALVLMMCLSLVSTTFAQAQSAPADDNKLAKNVSHEPRAASGKKLLTATDLMKINGRWRAAHFSRWLARRLHRQRNQNGEGQRMENSDPDLGGAGRWRQSAPVHAR